MRKENKIGLVLGGGAARGLAHIGLLEFFDEKGLRFDIICGNSMGAFIGALYLLNKDVYSLKQVLLDYLQNPLYRKLKFSYWLQSRKQGSVIHQMKGLIKKGVITFSFFRSCLVSNEVYDKVIGYFFDNYTFSDLRLPFGCSALDLASGQEIIFGKGPLKPAIMATCALPGILPPVKMGNCLLVDGGFINRVPVKLAHFLGADVTIAIDVGGNLTPPKSLNTGIEIVLRANAMVRYYLNQIQIKEADLVLKPRVGHIHWADFDRLSELIDLGRRCAEENWSQIRSILEI